MLPKSEEKVRNALKNSGLSQKDIEIGVSYGRNYIESEYEISKIMHNSAILQNSLKPSERTIEAIGKLLSCDVFIYQINGEEEFITTDNPFYSMDESDKTFHIKFVDDKMHILPFSSKYTIIFSKNKRPETGEVRIEYRNLDVKLIDSINAESARHRNKYIYCGNRDYLNYFITLITKK